MKKILLTIAALGLCLTAFAGSRIQTDSLESNILGATLKYNVYLPDGYDRENALYPVVYLLHGLSDDYTAWVNRGYMKALADELIRSGEACKMIIVMPGAGNWDTHHTQCGYFNVEGWNYEDFFFNEFMPQVEQKYRGISDKDHRAIMGLSMGGGGSTVYCQRHPECFSSCYAMSPWLDEDRHVGYDPNTKDCLYLTCKSVHEHNAIEFVKNADPSTIAALKTIYWVFDCGDDDFLLDLTWDMHKALQGAKIKHELRIRDGIHDWEYWHGALRTALATATRNFAR